MDKEYTIARSWEIFAKSCIHPNAHEAQIHLMKMAFYAGCTTVVIITQRIGENDISEEKGLEILFGLLNECNEYKESLKDQIFNEDENGNQS